MKFLYVTTIFFFSILLANSSDFMSFALKARESQQQQQQQQRSINNNNNSRVNYSNETQSKEILQAIQALFEISQKNIPLSTKFTNKTTPTTTTRRFTTPKSNLTKASTSRLSERRSNQNAPIEPDDYRIPFWNIAHMINSIDHIEPALREGANGIETDISFDSTGTPVEAYHGFPCDCGRHCHHRSDFIKFIRHIAEITSPPFSSRLLVLVLDLKLKQLNAQQKTVAGRYLAATLDSYLYRKYLEERKRYNDILVQPPVRVVISINHPVDKPLVHAFMSYVQENRLDFMLKMVGFDVGMNDDLAEIDSMWNEFNGATMNIWQGDGLTNCANIIRGVERLKKAISIRNDQGHFRKIYYWTADVLYHIRTVLRLGLDALLTNQPERVVGVLNEPEFRGKYRLATAYDDPFAQFSIAPISWQIQPPTVEEARETIENIQKTGAKFIKDLPQGISAILEKLVTSGRL